KYPDTYDPSTFPKILEAGHEFALHYNAFDRDGGAWGREHLAWQADFVRQEAGVDGFVSNKNHYTRWEGQVEFFYWLLGEGVGLDEFHGTSNQCPVGYPRGAAVPPVPPHQESRHFLQVPNLLSQYPPLAMTTPPYIAETTRQQAPRHP